MAGKTRVTVDHGEIQRWAEERGARPATVAGTGTGGPGVLRLLFPGTQSGRLEEIDWAAFFTKFEQKELAFLYQERTRDGAQSRFFRLIKRTYTGEGSSQRSREVA